ncbi:hypothetical protein ACET3X_005663 [Alternaria dauci]|uniref:Uncharacterized protein n=1 Tax=Alternaria dauci TaxID=48095 RepID=A0ABR3UIL8_9PLEO
MTLRPPASPKTHSPHPTKHCHHKLRYFGAFDWLHLQSLVIKCVVHPQTTPPLIYLVSDLQRPWPHSTAPPQLLYRITHTTAATMSTETGTKALKGEPETILNTFIFQGVDYARKISGKGKLIQIYDPTKDMSTPPY